MGHSQERNLGRLPQNGTERFNFGFLDSADGDPIQPSRNGDPQDQFDPNTVGQDNPDDFLTVTVQIRDRTSGAFRAPVAGENAPVVSDVQYAGPPEGRFDFLLTGQNTALTDDLVNEDWTLHPSGQVNGQVIPDQWEIFTVVEDGGGTFGTGGGYADRDLVLERANVTFADLGLADQDALNAHVDAMNRRVSAVIDNETERDFQHHTAELDTLDGNNRDSIRLRGYPVINLSQVKLDGTILDASEYRLKASDAGRSNAGILERKPPQVWRKGWGNLLVTYSWGYTSTPAAIQHVAEAVIIRLLQMRKTAGTAGTNAVTSWSMDGFSVAYDREQIRGNLTEDELAVLARYRRVVLA